MKKLNLEKMDYDVDKFDTWESKGKLNLSPEYQRDFVYSIPQSSKLIESSLMGIPLTVIYLCEENNDVDVFVGIMSMEVPPLCCCQKHYR